MSLKVVPSKMVKDTKRRSVPKAPGPSRASLAADAWFPRIGALPSQGGFPLTARATLRYCDNVSINPTLGNVGSYTIRANSIFDPDYAFGGHQPLGRDQWSAIYNRYMVVSSRIKCTFSSGEAAASNAIVANGLLLHDDGSLVTTGPSTVIEQGRSKTMFTSKAAETSILPSLSTSFDAKKFFNVKDVAAETDIGAVYSANPAREAFFIFWVGEMSRSIDLSPVLVSFVVEYDVVFSEPFELANS